MLMLITDPLAVLRYHISSNVRNWRTLSGSNLKVEFAVRSREPPMTVKFEKLMPSVD